MTPPGILPGKLLLLCFSCAQIQPQNPLLPFIYFYFVFTAKQSWDLLRKRDPECNSGNNLEALIPSTKTTINFLFWRFHNKNRRQKAEIFKKQEKYPKNSGNGVVFNNLLEG